MEKLHLHLRYQLAHARMRHFSVQLDLDLLLALSIWDPDLLEFLTDSRQDIFHLLLAEVAAHAYAGTTGIS